MRILIAEDTEDSRIFLEDYLTGMGFDVVGVENGEQAYDIAVEMPLSLIITDILMPELDGFGLCRRVKSNLSTAHIPVMFYTATYTEEQDRSLAMSLGASRFLVKPFEPEALLAEIKAVLRSSADSHSRLEGGNYTKEHVEVLTRKLDKKIEALNNEKISTENLHNQIEAINNALPILISELDKDLRYIYVNDAYEKWHKISKERIVGRRVWDLVGDDVYEKIRPHLSRALAGEKVFCEKELRYPDGLTRYIQAQYIPNIDKKGMVQGIYTIVADLTEKHQADLERERFEQRLRQGQKLELIGQLTGGIAHDFNNILGIINGFSSLALLQIQDSMNPALEKNLVEIQAAGQRGAGLVAQLLSFSRKSGENASLVDVNKAIRDLVTLLKPAIPATVAMDINVSEGSLWVNINSVQLDQVIMNICINAKDAMNGRGDITLTTRKTLVTQALCTSCLNELHGEFAEIVIQDAGPGIEADELQRIFEPFYTTKKQGEGTGLGLAITHSIVHDFSGHIVMETEQGKGCAVRILLPVQEVEAIPDSGLHRTELNVV
ncbi:MAG: response regulator [Gammaproteobacteria bacterium]|nr:response regulator [Gammaproteobacteria bacterium]MDH5801683.1 response regulator [Gammaproteobacteria bacterium]